MSENSILFPCRSIVDNRGVRTYSVENFMKLLRWNEIEFHRFSYFDLWKLFPTSILHLLTFFLSFCCFFKTISSTSSTRLSTGYRAIFPQKYVFSTVFTIVFFHPQRKKMKEPDSFCSYLHFSPSFSPGTAFSSPPAKSFWRYEK